MSDAPVVPDAWAMAYVMFAATKLGLPLSPKEIEHAARRAVVKQKSLEPLYEAARLAPVDGAIVFRAADPQDRTNAGGNVE
jgi:hypothetical protein